MIGFELKAEGSNGFRQKRSAWTEGSLLALKVALSIPKVNPSGQGKSRRAILDGIEASFSSIAKSALDSVCAEGPNFTLFMKRDVAFKYHFDYSKSSDRIKSEFLGMIASQVDGLGDQVMIYLCQTIQDFKTMNFDSNDTLVLTIDLDL